jgi:hypothetical protein
LFLNSSGPDLKAVAEEESRGFFRARIHKWTKPLVNITSIDQTSGILRFKNHNRYECHQVLRKSAREPEFSSSQVPVTLIEKRARVMSSRRGCFWLMKCRVEHGSWSEKGRFTDEPLDKWTRQRNLAVNGRPLNSDKHDEIEQITPVDRE